MLRVVRDNGISLAFGGLFLAATAGQAVAGLSEFNSTQLTQGGAPVGLGSYLLSGDFAVDVAENWQSEYLQFFLYVFATVWLLQRGSPESKTAGKRGRQSDEQQRVGPYAQPSSPRWARVGGWRTRLFSRSLGLMMGGLFLLSWLAQSVAGLASYNAEQLGEFCDPVTWTGYLATADFWSRTLQNWQSEFLAIGSMAIFSVYLRQRGSPESKRVGSAHLAEE